MTENVIASIARKLGGPVTLGLEVRSQGDLARLVQDRIPLGALSSLVREGLSEGEVERFVIPARTRRHRAARAERLTVEESDRAVRLARIQASAEETFGDATKANLWLRRGLAELSGRSPLEVAQTEAGERVVETILAKIAWGAAA
jgi:putative toxin-antitoxin system antitoxin component (TIGR02293 family)